MEQDNKTTKLVAVRLPLDVLEVVTRVAKREGTTFSAVIRRAVMRDMEQEQRPA